MDTKDRAAKDRAATNLAARLLAEPWTTEAIAGGVRDFLVGVHERTRTALVVRLAALGEGTYPPAPHTLKAYLAGSEFFRPAPGRPVPIVLDPPRFAPITPFAELRTPALTTLGDLAEWLALPVTQLDWLADERRGHGRAEDGRLQHYRYSFVRKQGGQTRLIEAPKPRLKAIQRRILHEILSVIPPHRCANGFVVGRSCLTGAQVHASEAVVVSYDLSQFFPSIGLPRIHGIFRCLGYPWAVARRLAGLCTTITPASVVRRLPDSESADRRAQMLYQAPHLPQGAPTSPALANLLAWTLDRRLRGLARATDANYTRYADDLAFSGDPGFANKLDRFGRAVEAIVQEEGFSLNTAKTRVMPRSTAQRVTGIVVNEHCNVGRAEFDALKAVLYNCARTNPDSQNRAKVADFRAHLGGRVSWVEQINPPRGAKLRRLYDMIDWNAHIS
jgi:retron-type reverse transcriptase